MKKHPSSFCLLLLAGLGVTFAFPASAGVGSSTVDRIAAEIAHDSGRPEADYRGYAARLAKTLTNLSPEVLDRVLKEHAGAVTGSTTDLGGTGTPPNDPTSGGTNTPADDPVVDGPLIDMLNGVPFTPPGALTAALLAASPLSEAVLAEVIVADDVMAPAGTVNILLSNMPLPTSVYNSIVTGGSDMWGSHLQTIVDAQAAATGGTTAP